MQNVSKQRKNSNCSSSSSIVANNIEREVEDILGLSWYDAEAEFQNKRNNKSNGNCKNSITRILFVAMFEDKGLIQLENEQQQQSSNDTSTSCTKKVSAYNANKSKGKKVSLVNEFIDQIKSSSSSNSGDDGDDTLKNDDIITGGILLLINNAHQASTPVTSSSYSSNKSTSPTTPFFKTSPIPVLGFIESSPCKVYDILKQMTVLIGNGKEINMHNPFHSIRVLSLTEDCPKREYEFELDLYVAPSQSSANADNHNDDNNDDQNDDQEENDEHINAVIESEGGALNVTANIFARLCSNEAKELFSKTKIQKYDYPFNTELVFRAFTGSNNSTNTAAPNSLKSITTIATTTTLLRKVIPSLNIIEACTKYKGYPTVKEFLNIFDSSILVELEGSVNSSYPQLLSPVIDLNRILCDKKFRDERIN